MWRNEHQVVRQENTRDAPQPGDRPNRASMAFVRGICLVLAFPVASSVAQESRSDDTAKWTPARVARECPLAFNAERLTLYKEQPQPLWFFPLLLTEVEQIGVISPDGDIRICETAYRSTWRERSLWLRVVVKPADQDEFVEGWLTVGPRDLDSFVSQATASRRD